MNFTETVLDWLGTVGYFVYSPKYWSDENDIVLNQLIKDNIIKPTEEDVMNKEYHYILA